MGIALDRSKWRSVISPKIAIFVSLTPFGLENIDPRSPKLFTLKFTGVPFHLPSLVTLALIEAEIAGRGRICPPPPFPGRVILRPFPVRVLIVIHARLCCRIIYGYTSSVYARRTAPSFREALVCVSAVAQRIMRLMSDDTGGPGSIGYGSFPLTTRT